MIGAGRSALRALALGCASGTDGATAVLYALGLGYPRFGLHPNPEVIG